MKKTIRRMQLDDLWIRFTQHLQDMHSSPFLQSREEAENFIMDRFSPEFMRKLPTSPAEKKAFDRLLIEGNPYRMIELLLLDQGALSHEIFTLTLKWHEATRELLHNARYVYLFAPENPPDTFWMCKRLQLSSDKEIASKADSIVMGVITPEAAIEQWNPGSFLRAVLEGKFLEALKKADPQNFQLLIDSLEAKITI